MYPSLSKIIYDHRRMVYQKGCHPNRLVEVWTDSFDYRPSEDRTSLVVTAFDLYSSLFGDCAYSIFSGLRTFRSMNHFRISRDQYTSLTHCIKKYLTIKKCSRRVTFRDVTPRGMDLLNKLAYEITELRVWDVKGVSLDPVYNPTRLPSSLEIKAEALIYSQSLTPYLIKDLIGIILTYAIDVSLPNHLRCSKETKEGTRCNQLRVTSLDSCRKHKDTPYYLANHY